MANVRPFRALRPVPEKAAQVSAPPYDVMNREEALAMAQGNPASFLRVSRAEITLPLATSPYSPEVYEAARKNLAELARECPLVRESEPTLYVYRLKMGTHTQVGVAATFAIDEYDDGRIKKHERTRQDKEDDRTRHVMTLQAQTGPVFLTYRGTGELDRLVEREMTAAGLFDFTSSDGVQHTLWKTRDPRALAEAFASVPTLYIADGHHRAASASRARAELRRANPSHSGREDYNFFLAVAFPASHLRILPYHRVIKDLAGRTPDSLQQALRDAGFEVTVGSSPNPPRGRFAMFLEGKWYGLNPSFAGAAPQNPIEGLDVSILQDRVLAPLFGIRDPRTDGRIDFVGGIRGTGELERLVRDGKAAVAFSLHPTTLEDLMAISDAGESMPPKSTWFEPKLRDGLLSHVIAQ